MKGGGVIQVPVPEFLDRKTKISVYLFIFALVGLTLLGFAFALLSSHGLP